MKSAIESNYFRDEFAPAFDEIMLESEEEVKITYRGIRFPEESELSYIELEDGVEIDIEILENEFKIPLLGEDENNDNVFEQLKFRVLYESICCYFYGKNQRWSFVQQISLNLPLEDDILDSYLLNTDFDEENTLILAFCSEIYELQQ